MVYVDGNWDLFNADIHTLRCCQQLGNYLVVGVHSDVVVVRRREIREIGMEPVLSAYLYASRCMCLSVRLCVH